VKHEYKKISGKYAVPIADRYWAIEDSSPIKQGDPLKGGSSLTRVHTAIVRVDDKRVLAEGVQYLRAGGDLIVVGHHSQASCPNMPFDLAKEALIRE
jgi:hypothetical protein